MTKLFNYNDIESLRRIIEEFPDQIACVMLEPAAMECPAIDKDTSGCCGRATCTRAFSTPQENFLKQVQELCNKNGIVFILDEMITGFRWGLGGAQEAFKLTPDLSTFGKAIANGFPLACVVGKRDIMSLGSIENQGQERLFLVSTTHGGDMASLGAFMGTVNFIKREPVVQHVWDFGFNLISVMNKSAKAHGLEEYFKVLGPACSPRFITLDKDMNNSFEFRTLFVQELINHKILMPWISIAYRHSNSIISEIEIALDSVFSLYSKALESGPMNFVKGSLIKPVFRKLN